MKQINNIISSTLQLKLEGLNFERFLQYLKMNNVTIYNLERPSYNTITFKLLESDYKKLLKLKSFRNYKVSVSNTRGAYYFIKNLKTKIGLLCGLAVSMALFAFFSMYTFNINIIGLENINKEDIVKLLNHNNISVGKINNIINSNVELMLKENFESISLVSVVKKGTNLIISIKEKELLNTDSYEVITAPINCIITKLEVVQGTALKNVGDIVKKGDAIIAPYYLNEFGERLAVEPIAEIELDAWVLESVEFETKKVTYERTGKKVVNSFFSFNNINFLHSTKGHSFNFFETTNFNENIFNNFFIPLSFTKVTHYELKQKIENLNFEEKKDALINESKVKAYSKFPSSNEVLEEVVTISKLGTKFIVQTALKYQLIITKH